MKMKMDVPPKENLLKEEAIIEKLNTVLNELTDDYWMWNEETYIHYIDIIKEIDFTGSITQKVWELNEKILNRLLLTLSGDFSYPFGWNLTPDFVDAINKTIDLKDENKFSGTLEILMQVDDYYNNFVSDDFRKINKSRRPIQDLILNLRQKSEDKDSNFLLSSYIEHISTNEPSEDGFLLTERFGDEIKYIGGGVFANISMSGGDDPLCMSKKEDYTLIKSLIEKGVNLLKELELLKSIDKIEYDNGNFSRKDRSDLWNKKITQYPGLGVGFDRNPRLKKSYLNEYKQIKEKLTPKSVKIFEEIKKYHGDKDDTVDSLKDKIKEMLIRNSEKIEKLVSIDNNQNDFKKIKSIDKDEILDLKIFATIWLNNNFRENVESQLGVKLDKFDIPEQAQIISFLKILSNRRSMDIKKFSERYNYLGFRTFLSIEQGGKEMGDKILTLGEKLPEDIAQKVFTKYGETIDNVNKITEFARNNFKKQIETSPELISKIEETLYIKGKQLLSGVYDDVIKQKEINHEEILGQLDRINADTITTFAIFKQAVKNGEKLPIESIEGSTFSKKEANEISNEQKTEMSELYDRNYMNHPNREFIAKVKEYFNTAFIPEENKNKNFFYTFEKDMQVNGKDKHIRAFVRFEKQNDESFYASALNVDEASKNFGLGEAMMDEALSREAKEHILHASCLKDNPSNMRYFEKGFISSGFKITNNTEEFDLVWDEAKNKDIIAKQMTKEELLNEFENKMNTLIEIKRSDDLNELHEGIPEGKSLVRCFVNNGEWYAVYEKVADNYGLKG